MYAKIFSQIFDSSIAEDYQTRHVFMDLLVLADPTGQVDMTHDAIARRTNVPVEIVRASICKLCKPDVNSRTKTHDGARLITIDPEREWGWQIVNFQSYHCIRNQNARREYMRDYMRARREKKNSVNNTVNSVNSCKRQLAHEDVYEDVDVYNNNSKPQNSGIFQNAPKREFSDEVLDVLEHLKTIADKPECLPSPDTLERNWDRLGGMLMLAWTAADWLEARKVYAKVYARDPANIMPWSMGWVMQAHKNAQALRDVPAENRGEYEKLQDELWRESLEWGAGKDASK